ncbi:DsbA family protein [Patulibacter minatonensis]|uniref:DsbA family protein n=1 Tax=Patulibacter minatonensis TaxID=298163 RepID=UPI0004794DD6|nr:DsbA family protein [Patulibacter minatonensis]
MSTDAPGPGDAALPLSQWSPGAPAADEPLHPPGGHDHGEGHVGDDHGAGGADDGVPDPEGPPAFYFDFRDPESYLAAERVMRTIGVPAPWVPIDSTRLPGPHVWDGFRCESDAAAARERVERIAAERGMQPLRWPAELPFDSTLALRAAWYAKGLGRVVSLSLPAFRQAYAGGHDLSTEAFVLISASAAEMHPRAVLQSLGRAPVIDALAAATDRAIERGVRSTPAIWTGDRVFHGDAGVDEAAAFFAARAAAS